MSRSKFDLDQIGIRKCTRQVRPTFEERLLSDVDIYRVVGHNNRNPIWDLDQ